MRYSIFIFFLLLVCKSFAQQLYPLNRDMVQNADEILIKSNMSFHSENKPYLESELKNFMNNDSVNIFKNRDNLLIGMIQTRFQYTLWKKTRNENLLLVKGEDFKISADPLFNFGFGMFKTFGKSMYNYNSTFINTRGAIIKGQIGKNVAFFTYLLENQGRFTDYINEKIIKTNVVPGEGRVKDFKKPNQYDYSSAMGLVSYSPSQHFNFQFGNHENFIGDGYRSLLLSDNSFNYPFLKMKMNFGKFEYTNIYATFQNAKYSLKLPYETVFQKKYATMHLLSYNVTKGFNIALFESTIWQARENNALKPFQIEYLNPVIGWQTIRYNLNGTNNSMLGLNTHYKFLKHHCFYGQLVIDDLGSDNNKYGYQLGYKYYNVFNIKNLYFQTEYNSVKPFTYANKDSVQNYTHYNQPLAHPLGANFMESVTFLNYTFRDLFIELKFNYAEYGSEISGYNYGQDIFRTQYYGPYPMNIIPPGNETGQGLKNILKYKSVRISYLVNPSTNLNFYFEVSDRVLKSNITDYHSTYISFGIRTAIDNYYFDF